jgi:hypothetical protein
MAKATAETFPLIPDAGDQMKGAVDPAGGIWDHQRPDVVAKMRADRTSSNTRRFIPPTPGGSGTGAQDHKGTG